MSASSCWRRCRSRWCASGCGPREGEDLAAVNERNRELHARVNATRQVYLSHTPLDGRYTIRMAIGARATERRHVQEAWALIAASA